MRYRPNAALILLNDAGEILLGERTDAPGSWQFPQGGAKKGEPLTHTLIREVREEIGLRAEAFEVLASHGPYRYQFPRGIKKNNCIGQEQMYFLSRLNPGFRLPGGPVTSREFRRIRWVAPSAFHITWVAEFKREVYRCVFHEALGVDLPTNMPTKTLTSEFNETPVDPVRPLDAVAPVASVLSKEVPAS
jgi:putative (di)nucleoside polyphosphate hydrolase